VKSDEARFNKGCHAFLVEVQEAVHSKKIENDSALHRQGTAGKPSSSTARDDG